MRERLHAYHQQYGYSPHSLVAISHSASGWEATRTRGAVAYLEVGRTWLASEPLAPAESLAVVAAEFLAFAASRDCFAVFMPVSERFARMGIAMGLDCVALGKSPYFDLPTWRCAGRRLYTVRKEVKKAERAGVTVNRVPGAELPRSEAEGLRQAWIATRRASGFGWIFSCDTFNFPGYQTHFLARNADGGLVGLLSAAPLPARDGYYFKDLHRHPGAPKGTADLLMVSALDHLRGEGYRFATPGTVPLLGIRDPGALARGDYGMAHRIMRLVARRGDRLYSFAGLHTFKARFAPTWWEYEYALAPPTWFAGLRVGVAAARATLPGGLLEAVRKLTWSRREAKD